ncbi:anti-sigma factor family protein [Rhizobium sp. PAMB 3182]
MLDLRNQTPTDGHDGIMELIPWYVNGSLPKDEMDAVRRHALTCRDCAEEIARQRKLAGHVAATETFEAPVSRSWETLRERISSERRAAKPAFSLRTWLRQHQGGMMLSGIGAAACVMVAVMTLPTDGDFQTLTASNTAAHDVIKFQTTPGVSTDELQTILGKYGLALDGGPSKAGVYTTKAKSGADLAALSKALMSTPEIIFAAPVE